MRVVLEAQKHAHIVVVCDDGSTDLTSEIAERLGAVVIRHESNLGYGADHTPTPSPTTIPTPEALSSPSPTPSHVPIGAQISVTTQAILYANTAVLIAATLALTKYIGKHKE